MRGSALRTRRGIRAVKFQPDFKTIQVWSKICRTFRWSQNVRMHLIFTTRLILGQYTDGREGVLEEAGGKQHITQAAPNELKLEGGGKVMRAGHRLGGGVGVCSSGIVWGEKIGDWKLLKCKWTRTLGISAWEAFELAYLTTGVHLNTGSDIGIDITYYESL